MKKTKKLKFFIHDIANSGKRKTRLIEILTKLNIEIIDSININNFKDFSKLVFDLYIFHESDLNKGIFQNQNILAKYIKNSKIPIIITTYTWDNNNVEDVYKQINEKNKNIIFYGSSKLLSDIENLINNSEEEIDGFFDNLILKQNNNKVEDKINVLIKLLIKSNIPDCYKYETFYCDNQKEINSLLSMEEDVFSKKYIELLSSIRDKFLA